MIIKNISIENFRSYYDNNRIELGDGLTLLIGSNGDGKTTFFEALEWLFDTVGKMPKVDTKYISKKKASELMENDSATVKVSMTYENNDSERIVEKSFKFTKNLNGEISTSNFSYCLYIQKGSEKEVRENDVAQQMFDVDFSASIRRYCLFKGEQELNIFNKAEAMSYLVETFSKVRDFDPYIDFVKKAEKWADDAHTAAIKSDKKNSSEAERLRRNINQETEKIGLLEEELKVKQKEAVNFTNLLDDLEKNREASELLNATNDRLETLKDEVAQVQRNISENYTFRLLDEMWILMGFEPIAEKYRELVGKLDFEERRMEREYQREQGAKKLASSMQQEINKGFVPLALNIPDENTMREMLDAHVCKVCGTPAPEGSAAYNTMKKHLDDYLKSLKETTEAEEEEDTLFKKEFVKELTSRYSVLHNNMGFITRLNGFIDKAIENNRKFHEQIDNLRANIEREEETKKKILAQTDGLTEDQLVSAFHNISEWWQLRSDAEKRSDFLTRQIETHREKLEEYQEEYSKISEESSAATYGRTSVAIRKISEAFQFAKARNKREFLKQLETETNEYLQRLNRGDFHGYAQIIPKADDSAELILSDSDGARIYNPNTALKTTMYMALLFAVAKLTTLKHENDYPLIFDAPTSSFTAAKESDFFGVIGDIKKQTIIVTKSFLLENGDGTSSLDMAKLNSINGKKYRIEKKRPFDKNDLSTIQTTVTLI